MRLKIILLIILTSCLIPGKPGFETGFMFGWYEPELTGLDTSLESSASGSDALRKNVLMGYDISFGLFPSVRVGIAQGGSYYSGEDDTTSFNRKLIYRMIYVETYYRIMRRVELNFAMAPMWNRGVINLDTQNKEKVWDATVGDYKLQVKAPEKMTVNFYGYSSTIGIRYYLLSWLAIDLKTGFMINNYNPGNWKNDGEKVTGPVLDMKQEPFYTLRLIFSW